MTETLEPVTKQKPEPTAEQTAAEELVRRAREQGLSLTGPDGLLKQLTNTVIETALGEEITGHLGYEQYCTPGPPASTPSKPTSDSSLATARSCTATTSPATSRPQRA